MRNKYFVFLRAINVSGKNVLIMDTFLKALIKNGIPTVKSYIQSGNFALVSNFSKLELQTIFEETLNEFNISTAVFILNEEELINVLEDSPFSRDLPGNQIYFGITNHKIENESLISLEAYITEGELIRSRNNIIHYYLPNGAAKTKLTNLLIEAKTKTPCTSRNRNTMEKMKVLI